MECKLVFTCECNKKEYPSMQSLKSHKKTKGHISWENEKEMRELKKSLTERDNEILALQIKIKRLKELNMSLILRIKEDVT